VKALLMYRDRDFDPHQLLRHYPTYGDRNVDPRLQLPAHERTLIQDLELDTLLHAMASNDEFLFEVAQKALLCGLQNEVETIVYRHEVLKDCLKNPVVVKQLYGIAVEAIEATRRRWWELSGHYLSSVLYGALDILETALGVVRKLRGIAEEQSGRFESEAFTVLFAMLKREFGDDYLADVQSHITESRFREGVLLSAHLGEWAESADLRLRRLPVKKPNWWQRIVGEKSPGYTFHLAERDEAGAQILSDMRQRGISRVAVALAQSADHVVSFFKMLRAELAFYCGCLNLHDRLAAKGEPVCFPTPVRAGERRHRFRGLYDVCLSLRMKGKVVGNAAGADGKSLVIVTGANQGGKSTFLRSIGLAQLMLQCGMFVGAEALEAELCPALFTHFKREEDATMKRGKLDEELARMSDIVDLLEPNSILLFNESFAATNEREGSEIARQIVCALVERGVKVFYVTHLYEFARAFVDRMSQDALFLRAERKADGTRTFRLLEGEPLDTSYGEDLYRKVFESEPTRQAREPDQASSGIGARP
jgi:hypothetical protein